MDVRKKLVEFLGADVCKHDRCEDCEYGDNLDACIDFLKERMADHLIAHGVTVQAWISVKDRLPEDDPTVKKHIEGEKFGFLTVLVYNGVVKETNRFFSNEPRYGLPKTNGWEWASSNVTHWMPLPEPPKGE